MPRVPAFGIAGRSHRAIAKVGHNSWRSRSCGSKRRRYHVLPPAARGAGAMARRAAGRAPVACGGRPLRYADHRGLRLCRQWPQTSRPVSTGRPARGSAAARLDRWSADAQRAKKPGLMLDGVMLAPARSHRVALGVQGSYAALKPIIEVPPVCGRDLFSLPARALRHTAARRVGVGDRRACRPRRRDDSVIRFQQLTTCSDF